MFRMYGEIEELTKQLVAVPSVNGTPGEAAIADTITRYFQALPYFQKHPSYLQAVPLKDDPLGRRNVFAFLKGEGSTSGRTLIFHGHTDTVGVDDFGPLKPYAFRCDALPEQMKAMALPEEIRNDLFSGDYLFGRGACDMKSGDAVFMVLLKYLSRQPETLDGNILVSFNPVEENLHTGIIEAIAFFEKLKKEEKLDYLFAVNNDYTCPLYRGDPHRYVYTGTVGKLLPCFYVCGKETHVGQCFEGFDAAEVAAELVRLMNKNPDYCDGYHGEYTLPPSVLHLRDQKDFYNVQTPQSAFVYFNYFVHNNSVKRILEMLKGTAMQALENVYSKLNDSYERFCEFSGIQYSKYQHSLQVLTYDELMGLAAARAGQGLKEDLGRQAEKELKAGTDKREISCHLVKSLVAKAGIGVPTVVVFFAPPYCPHNTLKEERPAEKKLYGELGSLLEQFSAESGEDYELLQFFPSLSDSSYFKIDDPEESIRLLVRNFPEFDALYPVPIRQIRSIGIPAVNYGAYGKDAHKWSERVYKPYTFDVLPRLILKTVSRYLTKEDRLPVL